jgi:hypothetical protein
MIDLEFEFRDMLRAMGLEKISAAQRQGMRDAFYGGIIVAAGIDTDESRAASFEQVNEYRRELSRRIAELG